MESKPNWAISFSTDELMSRPYQVINTYSTCIFTLSKTASMTIMMNQRQWVGKGKLVASPMFGCYQNQKLIQKITDRNQSCKFHESAKAIDDYIINNLSQIYIPITRGNYGMRMKKRRTEACNLCCLSKVLKTLDILIHPFCPFTSEYLYQTVFEEKQSILLDKWPYSEH